VSPLMSTPSIFNIAQPGSNPAMWAVVLCGMWYVCARTRYPYIIRDFDSKVASICHLPWKYFFNFIYNCTTWGVLVDTNCHLLAPVHQTQNPFGECQGLR
jgi:hypothetical protein